MEQNRRMRIIKSGKIEERDCDSRDAGTYIVRQDTNEKATRPKNKDNNGIVRC